MEINSFKNYWAGPWGTAGPRPFSACAARAKGGARRPGRASAHGRFAWPARLAGEGRGLAGARGRGGAAYPRAGASRPRQTTGRRAQGSRGQSGADAREKEDRVGAVHRRGHELRRAWPRPSGEENGHHGLSPRLRQPHTGATERARRGGAAGGRNRGKRRGRRSKSPAERLRRSVAELTARGRSCCGWLSAECCARTA